MNPWKGQRIDKEANDTNAVDEVWRSWTAKNGGCYHYLSLIQREYRDATINYNHLHVPIEFRCWYH